MPATGDVRARTLRPKVDDPMAGTAKMGAGPQALAVIPKYHGRLGGAPP